MIDVLMNHREFTTESNRTSDSIMRFYNLLACVRVRTVIELT